MVSRVLHSLVTSCDVKDADDRIINIHVTREVAHLNEEWSWPPLPDSVPQFISLFQPARVNDVNLKQQWSVFPYASSSYDRIDSDPLTKVGADFFGALQQTLNSLPQ